MNGTSRFELTTPVLRRFSAIELLVALVALFVSFPFVERFPSGALIESILLTLVLVSAVFAIEGRGRIFAIPKSGASGPRDIQKRPASLVKTTGRGEAVWTRKRFKSRKNTQIFREGTLQPRILRPAGVEPTTFSSGG